MAKDSRFAKGGYIPSREPYDDRIPFLLDTGYSTLQPIDAYYNQEVLDRLNEVEPPEPDCE